MSAPAAWLDARKRAIFASCRQLGIESDDRKLILRQVVGVDSMTALTLDQANRVLDHLRRVGATKPDKARTIGRHPGAPSTLEREPYLQKIEALLADMRLPWSYAEAIAENVTGGKSGGIKRLAWVRDGAHLRGIVSALMVEKRKRLKKAWAQLQAKLAERSLGMPWCKHQVEVMNRLFNPWPWAECLETLRMLEERLG